MTQVAGSVGAQDVQVPEREFHLVPAGTRPIQLSHGFIDPATVRVFVEGILWEAGRDFSLRSRSGILVPLRSWSTGAPADSTGTAKALVIVSYEFLPVPISPRKDLRPMARAPGPDDDDDGPTLISTTESTADWRTGNLQVSGSKTVQVSSGSRREMSVDQNLRLTIMGQLTDDISVRAFLSDDNLPVVPEGNTEELRDIDKVLVEIRASDWAATLGDFVASQQGTRYGNYRRKLQGISVEATPGRSEFGLLAGSPRGLYRTLQIRGEESNQGPYYLAGSSAEGSLFLVAGSERVTLDGVQMVRGSERDYVIDYVIGTITFTYRRLITAESTIVVEYEEGEGPYARTVVGGGAGSGFVIPGLQVPGALGFRVTREKDDALRLRTGELGPEDQEILAAAGDDPGKAVANGVVPTVPGEGLYDARDSTGTTIYVYNPDGGDFDIVTFYAGPGAGDYDFDRLTEAGERIYIYRGDTLGSYRIGRPLPLPDMLTLATMTASLGDSSGAHLKAEWNISEHDRNQLSDLDDGDNEGHAARVDGRLRNRQTPVGTFGLRGFFEQKDEQFQAFQITKSIFDYDPWGLSDRARRTGFLEEREKEAGVDGTWTLGAGDRQLDLIGNWGTLRHGADLSADQASGRANWVLMGGRGRHRIQGATALDVTDPLDITRSLRDNEIRWRIGPVVPMVRHLYRSWEDQAIGPERAAGFRLEEYTAGLSSATQGMLSWHVEFERGLADSLYTDDWELQRDSRTTRAGATTGSFGGMRLAGEATVREIESPDLPSQTTRLGRLNLSGRWDRSASDWNLGYRVDNSRTEVLDRQIVFVGDGLGDFNQDGDFVGPGRGDHKMVLAGTDSLVATTAVLADLNLRQGFKFLGADRWYGAWTSLTTASMEGRNTTDDTKRLLALDPAVIFDPETAVLGDFAFTEELIFLEHLRTFEIRGKFDYRQTRDRQFVDHPEDRLHRGWQINGNLNLSRRSSLKLKWLNLQENRYSQESSASSRRSHESATRRYEAGWNYNPSSDLKLGLLGEYITRNDDVSGVRQGEFALKPNGRGRFRRVWTAQGEIRISKVDSEEPPGSVRPFFYGIPGSNVESSLRLAWEPSQYLQVAASFFSRKLGERGWQHDVRLETTARF